ncbi:MAG: DUF3168 domain-containing protein [Amphiplicatus sp.]
MSVWALQKAVYAHLVADAGLKALLGDPPRLFDDPPPDAVFPYALLGETHAAAIAGLDGGIEHDLRIQIFSRYAGRREVKRVIDVLYDALHEADFAVEGATLVNCRFVFSDIFRRREAETYQGVARFRAATISNG